MWITWRRSTTGQPWRHAGKQRRGAVFQAMGPGMVDENCRDRYYKMLGIAPLPEEGEYFVSLDKYAKTSEACQARRSAGRLDPGPIVLATRRPWRAGRISPAGRLAGGQQAATRPLFVEASQRPRCFIPMVSGRMRNRTRCLDAGRQCCRAMRAGRWQSAHAAAARRQDRDQAWADLLASTAWPGLKARSDLIDGSWPSRSTGGLRGDQALLRHARLTAAEAARMRADLAALLPLPRSVDKIDVGERFMILDATAMLARGKGSFRFRGVSTKSAPTPPPSTGT